MPSLRDKRIIAALPGPAEGKGEAFHWDDELPGLGLRVLASGTRSWIVQYRVGKRQRRQSLGSLAVLSPAEARKRAREMLAKAKLGQDAAVEIAKVRAQASETFAKLAEGYITKVVEPRRRPRYVKEVQRYLLVDAKPLHDLPVSAINRQRIARLLGELAERGPVGADRCRAALSALFAWAMKQGLAEENPAAAVARPSENKARDRVLSLDELQALWRATEGPGDHNAIVRLLLLTGQRREEVGAMQWREIDTAKALWTIPGERTKNGRAHDVPLSDAALAILEGLPRRASVTPSGAVGRALVFGEGKGGYSGWSQAKARLDAKMAGALAGPELRRSEGEAWRLHDLRRTAVTHMAEIGIQPHVIEAVVNHISGHKAGVAGVYNRAVYAKEKREALQRWSDHVMALVAGEPSKVLPLHRARA